MSDQWMMFAFGFATCLGVEFVVLVCSIPWMMRESRRRASQKTLNG